MSSLSASISVSQRSRVEVELVFGVRVEGVVEHAEDLARLVAHDLPGLGVPQHGQRQPFVERVVRGGVGLAEEARTRWRDRRTRRR